MKRTRLFYLILLFGGVLLFSSCHKKYGCPANQPPSKKEIRKSRKGGSSNLFSKKTRKKVRSR